MAETMTLWRPSTAACRGAGRRQLTATIDLADGRRIGAVTDYAPHRRRCHCCRPEFGGRGEACLRAPSCRGVRRIVETASRCDDVDCPAPRLMRWPGGALPPPPGPSSLVTVRPACHGGAAGTCP